MLVEDIAAVTTDTVVATAGMLSDMPRSATLRADTLGFVFVADVVSILRGMGAAMRVILGAGTTRLAVVTGEVMVTGEVVPGIRTMDIPGSVITAWAIAIRITAIMVTDPVGAMIRITDIVLADTILTGTDTGPTSPSASVATKLKSPLT